MKSFILFGFILALTSCVTIYKNELSSTKHFLEDEGRSFQVVIGDEKITRTKSTETEVSSEISKIPIDTKAKLRAALQSQISNQCAESRGLKELEVSFETSIELDNTCWVFTLCYLVVPAMLTGTERLRVRFNQSESLYFKDSISYRSYAHVLLIPALVYKPFDQREIKAKNKLLESFSDKLCSSQKMEEFLKYE